MDIPNYHLIRCCGKGAFGEVWLARGLAGETVALKIIPEQALADKEFEGLKKCAALPPSAHRVRILHAGKAGGLLYYAMELADNIGSESEYRPATLYARLRKTGRMRAMEVITLGRALLLGIEELHTANLLHRDIKPGNVIYVAGRPKLSDIGLVCPRNGAEGAAGTIGFIPPEKQTSGSCADDLYALGKLLYCCWTGKTPDQCPLVPPECFGDPGADLLNPVILKAAAKLPETRKITNIAAFRKALSASPRDGNGALPLWEKCRRWVSAVTGGLRHTGESSAEPCDIFFSCSQSDVDFYGRTYIDELKKRIADELLPAAGRPVTFGESGALKYDENTHGVIRETVCRCRIFVALLSENYFQSQFCARECSWRLKKQDAALYFVRPGGDPFAAGQPVRRNFFGTGTEFFPWFTGKEVLKETLIRERVRRMYDTAAKASGICTVVPAPSRLFVGRIAELRALREACTAGVFPVIQAPGGAGKTELAAAYAYSYADCYGGGRFLLPMEGKHSWRDGILSLMENGKAARALQLGPELGVRSPEEQHRAILGALFRKAEAGTVLLFFDNVDDPSLFSEKKLREFSLDEPIPETLHGIATTRQTMTYPAGGRAKAFPLENLDEKTSVELFCRIGAGVFPFCDGAVPESDPELQAAKEMIRLLDGHVWSMEILAGYMAEKYSSGMTFQKKRNAWRKDFAVRGAGAYRHDAEDAETLLAPTLEKIAELPLGNAIGELAEILPFFPPDKIPVGVLEHYFRYHFGALEYADGEPFLHVLNVLKKFQLVKGDDRTLKVHRLTREVLKRKAAGKRTVYCGKLASALENCTFFSFFDWMQLLHSAPELFPMLSEPYRGLMFPPERWRLLFRNPALREFCPWEKLSTGQKLPLIGLHPEYAARLDFSGLRTPEEWASLLSVLPQFKDRCQLWGEFTGAEWCRLLSRQPQFEPDCPWRSVAFSSRQYADLLLAQPQFIRHLPADRCEAEIWFAVLTRRPEWIERCPWEKLRGPASLWALAFRRCPELAGSSRFLQHCPWDAFDGADWGQVPAGHPAFSRCRFGNFSSADWIVFLIAHPEFEEKCPWESIDFRQVPWRPMFRLQPQFVKHIPPEKITPAMWFDILRRGIPGAGPCPWEKLPPNASEWGSLLAARPEYESRCPFAKFTTGAEWAHLLRFAPEMVRYFSSDGFSGNDWADLLWRQPQLSRLCPWDKIRLSPQKRTFLLERAPELSRRLPPED